MGKNRKDINEQKQTCQLIDAKIPNMTETEYLYTEFQNKIYQCEIDNAKIIRNYTRYTNAIVWVNFIFKVVYFVGSCIVLYAITKVLIDVVYFAMDKQMPSGFVKFIFSNMTQNVEDFNKVEILLTTLTAFITAIIVIPLTIARYLFNQKEVEQFTALMQSVHQHHEKMLQTNKTILHSNETPTAPPGSNDSSKDSKQAS